MKINSANKPGDILIFLTGQEEVEKICKLLQEHANAMEETDKKDKLLILPLYGQLPHFEHLKVFKSTPKGHRKVVVATNVAETSLTIPGICHGKLNKQKFLFEYYVETKVLIRIPYAVLNFVNKSNWLCLFRHLIYFYQVSNHEDKISPMSAATDDVH